MPSYFLVSENNILLIGPLFSSFQEDAMLSSFGFIAEVLEMPAIPMGFVTEFESFNLQKMLEISPKALLDRAINLVDDLEADFSEEPEKFISKTLTQKMLKEPDEIDASIEDTAKEILTIKASALKKIKEAFIAHGLYN